MCWSKIFVWILKQKPSILVGSRHTWSFCARFLRKSWQRIFFFVTRSPAYLLRRSHIPNFGLMHWCAKFFVFLMRKNVYATESSSFFCAVENVHSSRIPSASFNSFSRSRKTKQCTHKFINFCSFFSIFLFGFLELSIFALFFILPRNYSSVNSLTLTFFSPSLRCFFSFSLCLAIKMAKNQRVKRKRNKMWSKNTCSLPQSILWDEKNLLSAFMRSSRHQKTSSMTWKHHFFLCLWFRFFPDLMIFNFDFYELRQSFTLSPHPIITNPTRFHLHLSSDAIKNIYSFSCQSSSHHSSSPH